ncbi:MAG: NTP transferase domain-containing protein [Candidatus Portnoybacteria bacterium]|nr:NTP transferase domain-containing protein [Candidatus Portnoybacteria bacterium]
MKGIILAGGNGTRLLPCTKVTNKHLLPVYDKPMIYYPLNVLIGAGIKDVMIVSGKGHAGHFLELLRSGEEFGARISYGVQEEAGGIAQALSLCEDFADNDKIMVILGDNIFSDIKVIKKAVQDFEEKDKGATIFLKKVPDLKRFGVAEVKNGKIIDMIEKPKKVKPNFLAQTGLYLYDNQVWGFIKMVSPSWRKELEITDVNNLYLKTRTLSYRILKGFWSDAGTFDSLLRSSAWAAKQKK